jgi:hypothetical protein
MAFQGLCDEKKERVPMKVKLSMFVLALSLLFLSACSSENFEGKWVLKNGDSGCPKSITFETDNIVTFHSARKMVITGTLEEIESNKYLFDSKGRGTLTFELTINDNILNMSDGSDSCNFQKQQ